MFLKSSISIPVESQFCPVANVLRHLQTQVLLAHIATLLLVWGMRLYVQFGLVFSPFFAAQSKVNISYQSFSAVGKMRKRAIRRGCSSNPTNSTIDGSKKCFYDCSISHHIVYFLDRHSVHSCTESSSSFASV